MWGSAIWHVGTDWDAPRHPFVKSILPNCQCCTSWRLLFGRTMCLSFRMFKSMIYSTCIRARTLYARFKCKPVNISVVIEYIPTKSRKSPSQAVVYKELRELLNKISRRGNIICTGGFNSRLCRNQWDLTGKWCFYKKVDSGGEILLQTMRKFGLIYDLAVSTMVQPKCMWDMAYVNDVASARLFFKAVLSSLSPTD